MVMVERPSPGQAARQPHSPGQQAQYLVPHVGLELELERRTEDLVAHVHDGVLVTPRIQVVHGILDDVQALVAGGFQVILCRQVSPECPSEAGMEPQVTALRNTKHRYHTSTAVTVLEGHMHIKHTGKQRMAQGNISAVVLGYI